MLLLECWKFPAAVSGSATVLAMKSWPVQVHPCRVQKVMLCCSTCSIHQDGIARSIDLRVKCSAVQVCDEVGDAASCHGRRHWACYNCYRTPSGDLATFLKTCLLRMSLNCEMIPDPVADSFSLPLRLACTQGLDVHANLQPRPVLTDARRVPDTNCHNLQPGQREYINTFLGSP